MVSFPFGSEEDTESSDAIPVRTSKDELLPTNEIGDLLGDLLGDLWEDCRTYVRCLALSVELRSLVVEGIWGRFELMLRSLPPE